MVCGSLKEKTKTWQNIMQQNLAARKYSRLTRKRYISIIKTLERFLLERSLECLLVDDIKGFLDLQEQNGAEASTLNQAISAIKFFYSTVLGQNLDIDFRPKADSRLPDILSEMDIERIISAAETPKHKLAIALAYSAGLRPSEIASLKMTDINIARKTILVRSGKGRKDRYTILANRTVDLLCKYVISEKPRTWLFPGNPDGHITTRALQYAMTQAVRRTGILNQVSLRTLRHSFATHLVENNTSILAVQDLLGHESLATTQIYLKTARLDTLKTTSPYDHQETNR